MLSREEIDHAVNEAVERGVNIHEHVANVGYRKGWRMRSCLP